jgi:hypothetical protein
MLLMMEEVSALQVRIALLIPGADRADIDGGFNLAAGGICGVLIRVPVRPLKLPLTFEIIMCFTLNSACECAGSIFQVMVETGATVLVDMAE